VAKVRRVSCEQHVLSAKNPIRFSFLQDLPDFVWLLSRFLHKIAFRKVDKHPLGTNGYKGTHGVAAIIPDDALGDGTCSIFVLPDFRS